MAKTDCMAEEIWGRAGDTGWGGGSVRLVSGHREKKKSWGGNRRGGSPRGSMVCKEQGCGGEKGLG